MNPERWQKIQELFLEVRELTSPARETLLRRMCGDDEALFNEVNSLLHSDQSAGSFLESSPISALDLAAQVSHVGRRAGPYHILTEIGQGGMGSVYLAERVDGQFKQQVALKVINPGMHSTEILKRFRNERQITARLQHPNIARLLDGGLTEGGLPFFTMEYVDGLPIDKYCDSRKLSLADKLALFAEVCRAVQYAHQQLIIHRDLKPSNIMVQQDGTVKLLDFGIAKVLDPAPDTAEDFDLTRTGMWVMSPAYASPEQFKGAPVSISTDIYSLGVVLYKLLTNRLPHEITSLSPGQIEAQVCRTDPERPSRLLARTGDGGPAKKLSRKLKGDLDIICQQALHKKPERRYHSAEQLAEDIERHLNGKPIRARKDTLGYTTTKFIKRNRGPVATALLVLLSTAFLIAYYTTQLTAERNLAREEAATSAQITEFLMSLFEVADPGLSQGEEITARELLGRGSHRIEAELSGQPEIQARLMHVLGRVYYTLGMYQESKSMTEGAIKHAQSIMAVDDPGMAEYISTLSWVLDIESKLDSALLLSAEALEINLQNFGEQSLAVGKSYHELATVYRHKGDFATADSLYRKALTIKKSLPDIDDVELAHTLNHYARLLYQRGDLAGSVPVYEEALAKREYALGREHPETVASMAGLAAALSELGQYDRAESLYRECLAAVRKTSGETHPYYGGILQSLATVLYQKSEYRQAEEYYREAIENQRRVYSRENAKVSNPLLGLGTLLNKTGRTTEGLSYLEEATKIRRNTLGEQHWLTAVAEVALGECLTAMGKYDEAETVLLSGYENLLQTFDKGNEHLVRALADLAGLYEKRGEAEKAEHYRSLTTDSSQ